MLTETCAFALLLHLLLLRITFSISQDVEFTFNGFIGSNLTLDGTARIESNGLLRLTNKTDRMKGHAFYPSPVHFGSTTTSFSTIFAFAIMSDYFDLSGHGLAFFISPTDNLSTAMPSQYLGLLNTKNNGNLTNHMFAVELDTIYSSEFHDLNGNHIGIDINSLVSSQSYVSGYYDDSGAFHNLSLVSGKVMQVCVDYESQSTQINVTLFPIRMPKPIKPLLSYKFNLSTVLNDSTYIGFSSSTGIFPSSHYILGWSFKLNGAAPSIDLSRLPELPAMTSKDQPKVLDTVLPFVLSTIALIVIASFFFYILRRYKYAELLEDWELEFGPHRFSYKDLYQATNGFNELLGSGGFGRVYRGVLPASKYEVAVKRISHDSTHGMKQFIAEIVSLGRVRHRNLVQLWGYCRREGELLLVYDYMPNGSLDRYLYGRDMPFLNWIQRFKIIKGVASGLLYLHQEWEQVVIHRDIKASNVLLDSELNARLGDFGLAILYDHGADPQPTKVVGTMGYLAPELTRTGKATAFTDVYAFGAFMLEVVCGRRPVEPREEGDRMILVDLVLDHWEHGSLIDIVDPKLRGSYGIEEVEKVIKLSMLCSHPLAGARPSMQHVVQFLEGTRPLPELSVVAYRNYCTLAMLQTEGFGSCARSYSSNASSILSLSGGR
jgi:Legume lectin domain/Protein kinase domain